jgi:hypothetical protein
MNGHILHDAAYAASVAILEVIRPVLRDDEVKDAFSEIFDRVKGGMEIYLILFLQEQRRLNPCSRN